MTEEQSLTVTQPVILTPKGVVDNATTQAKLLMDIVEKTNCYQLISGKKYLQVEAWETIGAFNQIHAQTEYIEPITKKDEVIGYKANVLLWKNEQIVGGAIMPCYFTENCCKGKEGDAKHKACMSAAQTFATSKAYRMNYSYVAILAGYEPTPAEEMQGGSKTVKKEHWCEEHNCPFEKKTRGGSTWYAHKLPDGWCNETKKGEAPPEAKASIKSPEAPAQVTAEESQQPQRDPETIKTFTDLYKACKEDFTVPDKEGVPKPMQPFQVIAELGFSSQSDISDTPADCYRKIAAVR